MPVSPALSSSAFAPEIWPYPLATTDAAKFTFNFAIILTVVIDTQFLTRPIDQTDTDGSYQHFINSV